jgi:hypothetical protein
MTTKKETTKQPVSEKRLFKELQDLRTTVGHIYKVFDERYDEHRREIKTLKKELEQPLSPNQEAYLKSWRVMHDPEHKDKTVEQIWGLLNDAPKQDSKPDPKKYMLTDADWQRVIKEQWLCEFWDAFEKPQPEVFRFIGELEAKQANGKFLRRYSHHYNHCRPLNKPGVMQPYFGQGMPGKAGTKVLVKQRNGLYCIGKALEQDWNIMGCSSDIVSFTILE